MKLAKLGCGLIAAITDDAADSGLIFLFNVGIIIFPTRTASGKGKAALLTERDEMVINKLAAVVAMNSANGEGSPANNTDNGGDNGRSTIT